MSFRPWYAEANAPIAKDIIIVFDFTKYEGSQENLEAIKLILKTTNPNDRVSALYISYKSLIFLLRSECLGIRGPWITNEMF